MTTPRTVVARSERSARTRHNAEIAWYVVLSLILGLVLVAAIISTAALVPAYCGACHLGEATALGQSGHAGTHCDACHGATTLFGLIDRRLNLVSMVGSQLTPGTQQVVAAVGNEMCLSCHDKDVVSGTVTGRGIRMSHKEVIAAKWRCTDCHAATAHAGAQSNTSGYSMDSCLECHSADPKNVKTCEVCHVGKAKPQRGVSAVSSWKITHGPDWRKTHGLGNLKTCASCHGPGYCVRCHNMRMPHSENFPRTHGQEVVNRATGDEDCLTCHERKTCDGCHGVTMPHPVEFLRTHAEEVERSGREACYRCHRESSCINCHTRHAHPGLAKDYIEQLRANPVRVP